MNINGTQKKNKLQYLLTKNNIHIACLQEIKLNKNMKFEIKDYRSIRNDRADRTGGGLAILVKNCIKFKEVVVPATEDPSILQH